MVALHHVDLADVREAEHEIRRGVVELRRVQKAAVDRRDDVATAHDRDRDAHLVVEVRRKPDRTVLQDPQVVGRLDRLLEPAERSEEHTSELQSLMRISYAVFCLKKTRHDIELPATGRAKVRTTI